MFLFSSRNTRLKERNLVLVSKSRLLVRHCFWVMIYIIARQVQVLVQVSILVETFAAKVSRQLFVIVHFLGIDTHGTAGAVALCAIDRYIHSIKLSNTAHYTF